MSFCSRLFVFLSATSTTQEITNRIQKNIQEMSVTRAGTTDLSLGLIRHEARFQRPTHGANLHASPVLERWSLVYTSPSM